MRYLPWPLWGVKTSPSGKEREYRLLPLFRFARGEEEKSTWVLWPLFIVRTHNEGASHHLTATHRYMDGGVFNEEIELRGILPARRDLSNRGSAFI